MEKNKVKNLPHLTDREIEAGLRLRKISKLACKGNMLSPFAEYVYDDADHQETEIAREDIIARGVVFESGYPDTRVRVLVRPDTHRDTMIEALYAVIQVIGDRKRKNWLKELAEAVDRETTEAGMHYSRDEISLAEMAKQEGPSDARP